MTSDIHKENPNLGDQLVVRVGKGCNFRCNFCNVSTNEGNVKMKENIDDLVRNFHYKMKYSNFTDKKIEITISGGEPSIFQKETLFALKYINRFFQKRDIDCTFGLQTNASNIDSSFAKRIAELGIQYALVSFHTHKREVFESSLGVSYDSYFSKILEGIKNLQDAGIQVDTNTILSQQNKGSFFETIQFLYENFPGIENFNIGVVQPHGEAEKNKELVAPKYEEIEKEYNDAITYIKAKGKRITSHFVGLPPCYLKHHDCSLELQSNLEFRKNFNFQKKYLINKINDSNKSQIGECRNCLYNNVCSGIWTRYIDYQKVLPVKYFLTQSDNKENFPQTHIVSDIGTDFKTLVSQGIQQIVVLNTIGTWDEILIILQKATSAGIYKVTLSLETQLQMDRRIFLSGCTNIQGNIDFFDREFLLEVEDFSRSNGPQFRVDIDISVKPTQIDSGLIPFFQKSSYIVFRNIADA